MTPDHVDKHYRLYFFNNFFRVWTEGKLFKNFQNQLDLVTTEKEIHEVLINWIDKISELYSDNVNNPIIFDQGLLIENSEAILKTIKDTKFVLVIRNPIKQIADILEKSFIPKRHVLENQISIWS